MHISLLVLLIIPYFIIITSFIKGWFRIQKIPEYTDLPKPFISIIIPVRNEENNLPALISDLLKQNYPSERFEIIFINDHSEDRTCGIINGFLLEQKTLKLISLTKTSGKKAAVWEGVNAANGEFIITTDGDCHYQEQWISSMANYFINYPSTLIVGPVFFKCPYGLFNQFQSLEFLSLIASGAGAAGIGRPILCNGANLGGSRNLFIRAANVYKSSIASGDDIFLLLELKKLRVPVLFAKCNEAVVETDHSPHFRKFMDQRTRWTFKSRFYRDPDIIKVALTVLFTNLLLLAGLFYSIIRPQYFISFLFFYLLKCFVDYILLYNVARFFNRTKLLNYFLIHQLFYIFYVSFVGIAGHFFGEKWKAKTIIK